jgi:hypothetical protein
MPPSVPFEPVAAMLAMSKTLSLRAILATSTTIEFKF